mgnify:CR=1 FL=1
MHLSLNVLSQWQYRWALITYCNKSFAFMMMSFTTAIPQCSINFLSYSNFYSLSTLAEQLPLII